MKVETCITLFCGNSSGLSLTPYLSYIKAREIFEMQQRYTVT